MSLTPVLGSEYTHSRTLTVIPYLLDPMSLRFLSALQPARTLCPSYCADDTLESDHWQQDVLKYKSI